jgi:ribose transport system substrate-binding protein
MTARQWWGIKRKVLVLAFAVVFVASACTNAASAPAGGATPQASAAPSSAAPSSAAPSSAAPSSAAPSSAATGTTTSCKGKNKTVGFAMINLTLPFFANFRKAGDEALAAYGVKGIWQSSDGVLEKEVSIIQNFISQKVDGIAVDPLNATALVPVFNQASDAGIPIEGAGNKVAGKANHNALYPDYDNFIVQARILGKALNGKGTVLFLIGAVGNYVSDTRQKGFMDTMAAEFPDIKVLVQPTNWDSSTATTVTQTVLTSNPDLAGVATVSDGLTLPALKVLEAAGKLGIPFVAMDGDPQVFPYIDKGQVIADVMTADTRVGAWQAGIVARLACGATFPTDLYLKTYRVMSDGGAAKVKASGVDLGDYVTTAKAQKIYDSAAIEFGPDVPDSAMTVK